MAFADILKQLENSTQSKLAAKLPQWAAVEGIRIANSLALEQCSSTAAALHKAKVVADLTGGGAPAETGGATALKLADLTGGMGVDSWAFSHFFSEVWYNEMQPDLCSASSDNFRLLGRDNILCNNYLIDPSESGWEEALREFAPDVIYLDPARRSATGGKVFLPEDCSPDFLTLMPQLSRIAKWIVVKLSPMADISMLRRRIGPALREIRVTGLGGECKELLCIISAANDNIATTDTSKSDFTICADIIDKDFSLSACWSEAGSSVCPLAQSIEPGMLLAEPHPAVMKAGVQEILFRDMGMLKAGPFTHIYIGEASTPVDPSPLKGCVRRITEVIPFGKEGMKYIGKTYPRAEFTARGIHLTSEQLAKRCDCKSGGGIHVFGVAASSNSLLIITEAL